MTMLSPSQVALDTGSARSALTDPLVVNNAATSSHEVLELAAVVSETASVVSVAALVAGGLVVTELVSVSSSAELQAAANSAITHTSEARVFVMT